MLLGAFWGLITLGGAANDGYKQYDQFVSSLASRGAMVPWFGLAALLCVASAHLLLVPQLRRTDAWVGGAVFMAGLSLLVVAAFRVQCPGGDYCVASAEPDAIESAHVIGVLAYTAAMVVAMVRAGVLALRSPRTRLLGYASLGASGIFVTALVLTSGPAPGLSQRFWALVGQVWLVVVAAETALPPRGNSTTTAVVDGKAT